MQFRTLAGDIVRRNYTRYFIKWDAKSRSKLQFRVKQLLKPIWLAHVVYEEFPLVGTRLKVDFINLTKHVAVEVNGPQHEKFNKFFHNNSRLQWVNSLDRDMTKIQWLEKNNFRLVEIIEDDLKDLEAFYRRVV